jgi:serine/threonine protein phosphatase 1
MQRLIIFSDIHGELWKLQELFNRLSLQKDDRIIFLGDYIDRGENSRGVIDYIINLQKRYDVVTLLGNHEAFALEVMTDRRMGMIKSWFSIGGKATLDNYNGDFDEMERVHGNFLHNLKLIHEEEKYIFVHGYLAHLLDVEEQHKDSCIWGRFDEIKPHKSGKIVVCGHTIQHGGPTDLGYKVCIDTGSFKPDGYITAMVIDGDKVSYVKSN